MKLYDSARAPNPRRVRIYLAEKRISVPTEQVDIATLAQKSDAFTAVNPLQRLPALELDDGTVIAESIAICRYFEALHPDPPLFGQGPAGQAIVEMWQRRIEFHLLMPVSYTFRHLHPGAAAIEPRQIAPWGEENRQRALDFLALMNEALAQSEFIASDHLSVADITGLCAIDFMRPSKFGVPEELAHVRRWHEALAARPSAGA